MMVFGRKNKEKKEKEALNGDLKRFSKHSADSSRPVLGVHLPTAVANSPCNDGVPIPAVVRQCINYINEKGLEVEGIYRISPSKSKLDELEKATNAGEAPTFTDPHDAAGLLKRFLRQLPQHVLTDRLRREIESIALKCTCGAALPCRCEAVSLLAERLKELPIENYTLLGFVFRHAQLVVQNQNVNKMNLAALGVLLQAMLNLSRNEVRIFLLNASSLLLTDDNPIIELFSEICLFQPDVSVNEDELKLEISKGEERIQVLQRQVGESSKNRSEREKQLREAEAQLTQLKEKLRLFEQSRQELNQNEQLRLQNSSPPPAFLEKQLLAVHTSLQNEVNEEKKKVATLLTHLHQLQSQLPKDVLEQLKNGIDRNSVCEPENEQLSPVSMNLGEEEAHRDQLLLDINKYRDLCARLRARLEQYTVLLNASKQSNEQLVANCVSMGLPPPPKSGTDSNETPNGPSLLVTRF